MRRIIDITLGALLIAGGAAIIAFGVLLELAPLIILYLMLT